MAHSPAADRQSVTVQTIAHPRRRAKTPSPVMFSASETSIPFSRRKVGLLTSSSSQHQLDREESLSDLKDFIENVAVPLHWVGPDGTILWANRAELEFLGYAPEEYIGRKITEFH